VSLRIRDLPSPNHEARPANTPIDMLILHYTGMTTAQEAIDRLRDPISRASSHYVVDEDGAVLRLVPETRCAFHAGVSYWRGHSALNGRSIGIEVVNPGHAWGYRDFPVLQLAAVCDLSLAILARHPIPARNVIAHSDVAPDREADPGERFDWRSLAQNGVGLWPEEVPDLGIDGAASDAAGLGAVRASLAGIGYCVAPEGALDPALAGILRAFQRHWRPEAITGAADAGTRARIAGVLRLVGAPDPPQHADGRCLQACPSPSDPDRVPVLGPLATPRVAGGN
jgi:N-acetylmuramoyl-L-alanine amidase